MGRFEQQTFVVTGGASGIGEATVRALVKEGGRVVIADIQQGLAEKLVAELGGNTVFAHTDVTREEDIAAAIALAQSTFGTLDGMVNNAGIVGAVGSIMETSCEAFDRTMAILSRAVFLGIKHAARAMLPQGKGSIVSLASTAGIVGGLGPHVYTMAKHGVVGLTKSAASELSQHGIRVNAVAPGSIVTPLTSALVDNDVAQITQAIADESPLRRAGMPQDVANAILFALSSDSSYMTGQTLVIDAGITTGGAPPQFASGPAEILWHAGQRTADIASS